MENIEIQPFDWDGAFWDRVGRLEHSISRTGRGGPVDRIVQVGSHVENSFQEKQFSIILSSDLNF